jgi:hypothetical protein
VFSIRLIFGMRQVFTIRQVFSIRLIFGMRQVFTRRRYFVYFAAPIFLYIFLHFCLVCADNLIGANILEL